MPGLFDFLQQPDAQLGLQLLAAGGYSPTPMGAGQRIAGALQNFQAQQVTNAQQQLALQKAAQEMQLSRLLASRFAGGGAPAGGSPAGGAGVAPMPVGSAPSGAGAGGGSGGAGVAVPSGGAGGAYPLNLSDIGLMTAMGMKGAENLFNQYKYATDGVQQVAGNYYKDPMTGAVRYLPKLDVGQEIGPDGAVRPVAGYMASNAAIKGVEAGATTRATEAAKYPFTVGADRERQTTQAALDPQAVVGADGNTYYVPRLSVATGATGAGGAGQGGAVAGGAPAQGGFMAGRDPVRQQSATALNDNWIKNAYQPTLDAGNAASDALTNIQALRTIDLKTGWGTDAKATAANVLTGMGIAPKNAEMFATNAQKFQSVAMDRLMKKQVEQKGTATEGDAKRINQTYVSLQNTPAANDFILDLAQAQANQDQRRAQYYEAALPLAQKSGDLTRVDREWRKIKGSIWADPVLQRWSR
ncbi:hypothetical protein ABL840_05070 [Variovorax sp. NFACC27]|uniref:hypothetical protein n=1 Tax=unclassified Variovorax TaxID=663243 RepID=UPI00089A8AA4|nr:hypothetical protein SAMN03159371_00147 [Variovorax sp. NFACC28]SEF71434.1 hypothetical protein SAMN03159365_00671 [Variovorax sp. NFACC29]SFB76827.1 hypothetical protein SAMN03159379_00670 [Variovorax sp. NFACC26]SFG76466.1 hypothetical protein SAMN03159447_04793 [Variovorax sp. NFACC27]